MVFTTGMNCYIYRNTDMNYVQTKLNTLWQD